MLRTKAAFTAMCVLAAVLALLTFERAAAAPGDSDNDSLPDAWEMTYFANLAQTDTGDTDSDGYSNLAEYNNGTDPTTAEVLPPYLTTLEWTSVGPGGGGAQYSPTISPTDPNLMYGICDMGGVYRSTDGGRHWMMLKADEAQMATAYSPVHCNPKFHPTNGNIWYVGTLSGLKRTTDGGETWEYLSTNDVPTAIAIHRSSPDVMVYGNNSGYMYRSSNGGTAWTEITGWRTYVNSVPNDIFIDASSAAGTPTIFASTAIGGIYKSTDGGATWAASNAGLPRTDLYDFDGGMQDGSPVLYVAVPNSGVYRSLNRGSSWSSRNSGLNTSAGQITEIGVCEGQADYVYAGSTENGGPTVYKTTNGGSNWTTVLTDPTAGNFPAGVTVARDWMTVSLGWAWGEEPHEIGVSGGDPNYVAFAEDGRTWRSNDGGASWFCCNDDETSVGSNWWRSTGFETTTNYRVHFAPWNHDRAYISYTDIGAFRSEDRAESWRYCATGIPYRNTVYDIAFDPTVSGKMWAVCSNNHDLPHEKMLRQSGFLNFTGAVVVSTNNGVTWTNLGHPIGTNMGAITSIVVDPTSPSSGRTLYCAVMGRGVYKSTNGGTSWTAVNNGLGTADNKNALLLKLMSDGTLYCAVTEAMTPSSQRYPGGIYKTTDGGANWTLVNTGQTLPYICGFDVDATDQNKIYAASFQTGGVNYGLWKTTNGGTTWQRTLALGDTYGADIDPERTTRVYATIEQGENFWSQGGMYISEDSGANWTKLDGMPFERYGPNYVSFDPDDSQIIYVTTFGGGVWKTEVAHADEPVASFTATPPTGPAPLDVQFSSSPSTGDITTYTWDFGDGSTSHSANPLHTYSSNGAYTVTLKIEGRNGTDETSMAVEAADTDSDGDGLPDGWEIDYFGDLDETAGGDADGDGETNLTEYANGTDPTQDDVDAPVTSNVATVPSQVRTGVDAQILLTATASDSATGNSRIAGGEYFVDVLGPEGTGRGMQASDGAFDESYESIRATVNSSQWEMGTVTLYVRCRDYYGQWSDAASLEVDVVDSTPPGAVTDLSAESALQFEKVASESWETAGTVAAEEETTTIDLGESKMIGAVSLTPTADRRVFPWMFTIEGSEDDVTYETLASAYGFRTTSGTSLWMTTPGEYRYIKMTATGRRARDRHYYVKIGEIGIWETTEDNMVRATWRATADDGYSAASGDATEYDVRYSDTLITQAGFESCDQAVDGVPVPGARLTAETAEFSVGGLAGRVYVAVKVGDEVPNWSALSNVVSCDVEITGLQNVSPADEISVQLDTAMEFHYLRGSDIVRGYMTFSDRPDFPRSSIKNPDGTVSQTLRYALKRDASMWKPSAGQWKAMKRLASYTGTLYWRLEGVSRVYKNIYGPTRAFFFDIGTISDLAVADSYLLVADEAIAPVVYMSPLFTWTHGFSLQMKYFYVDVSTDMTMPMRDRKQSVSLCRKGIAAGPYKATNAKWRSIRRLAAKSDGVLYWRVRAADSDRVYIYASDVSMLVIDGGEFVVDPVDLSEDTPLVSWTHTGDGIEKFSVEFCINDEFANTRRETLRVPSRPVSDQEYQLSAKQKQVLLNFAARNSVDTLYYRIRGEDAERAFMTYSDASTTAVP